MQNQPESYGTWAEVGRGDGAPANESEREG